MIAVNIKVQNLDQLRRNFKQTPALTFKYLARATSASLFEVEKQSVDRNFQFKTPRALRTGQLANSFSQGRYIAPNGLSGAIGPTIKYAPYVYYGTNRSRPNKYMDRIARAAEPAVQKHFQDAVDKVVNHLAK